MIISNLSENLPNGLYTQMAIFHLNPHYPDENCHLGVYSIFRLSRPYTRSGCEHPSISYFGVQKKGVPDQCFEP